MKRELIHHFADFMDHVYKRLEAGAVQYGDRSFEMSDARLVREVREELWDVAGWAVILDMRLRAVEEALKEEGE